MLNRCHKCPRRSCGGKHLPPCTGVMLCTVSGRDIADHAAKGDCPEGRFTEATIAAVAPTPPQPIHGWPWSLRAIAALRIADDKGIGDTIHRHLERFGAGAMQWVYKRIVGKDCGCGDRKQRLNRMFPYPSSTSPGS